MHRFLLRLPKSLFAFIAEQAGKEDRSINTKIFRILKEWATKRGWKGE